MADLNLLAVENMQRELRALQSTSVMDQAAVRLHAARLGDALTRHAEKLLSLALDAMQARDCAKCGGTGKLMIILDCDDSRMASCANCKGSGRAPASTGDSQQLDEGTQR